MKLILLSALISGLISSTIASAAIPAELRPALNAQSTPKDSAVKSWDRPALRLTLSTSATQLKFSGDGELLITRATEQTAELWNLTTGKRQSTFPAKPGFAFCDVALSADGQFAAALLHSREASSVPTKRKIELKVWNVKTGQTQWTSPIQEHVIQMNQTTRCEVEFSPNSQILATSISSFSGQLQPGVRLWSVPQGKLQSVTSSRVTSVGNLAFSRDSSILGFSTLVDNQAQVHLWNLNDRKLQATLKAVEGNYPLGIFAVLFTPNQQDVIAYTNDGGIFSRLYRWQVQTGKLKDASVLAPDRTDRFLGISPDGETYVYGGDVTGYHIGNLRTNSSVEFPQGLRPTNATRKVVFSPDGQQMAISNDQAIVILQRNSVPK